MSGYIADEGDPTTCWDCGAKHAGGEPFHKTYHNINDVLHFEYRCAECIDAYSRASWPEDDWGSYPGTPIPPPTGRPS